MHPHDFRSVTDHLYDAYCVVHEELRRVQKENKALLEDLCLAKAANGSINVRLGNNMETDGSRVIKMGAEWFLEGERLFDVFRMRSLVFTSPICNVMISKTGKMAFSCNNRVFLEVEERMYIVEDDIVPFTDYRIITNTAPPSYENGMEIPEEPSEEIEGSEEEIEGSEAEDSSKSRSKSSSDKETSKENSSGSKKVKKGKGKDKENKEKAASEKCANEKKIEHEKKRIERRGHKVEVPGSKVDNKRIPIAFIGDDLVIARAEGVYRFRDFLQEWFIEVENAHCLVCEEGRIYIGTRDRYVHIYKESGKFERSVEIQIPFESFTVREGRIVTMGEGGICMDPEGIAYEMVHESRVMAADYDGRFLAYGDSRGEVRLAIPGEKALSETDSVTFKCPVLMLIKRGQILFCGIENRTVVVVDLEKRKSMQIVLTGNPVDMSIIGDTLAVVDNNGKLQVFRMGHFV